MNETLKTQGDLVRKQDKINWWMQVKGILLFPKRLFKESIDQINPLFAAVLMIFGSSFAAISIFVSQKSKIIIQIHKALSDAYLSSQQINDFANLVGSSLVITVLVIFTVLIVLMTWVIKAGIFHFLAKILGGRGNFLQSFKIVGLAWFPLFLGSLFKGIFSLVTGRLPIIEGNVFFASFLTNTDIFYIWNMVLMTIGFSVVYGISKKKAVIPILGVWSLGILFSYFSSPT